MKRTTIVVTNTTMDKVRHLAKILRCNQQEVWSIVVDCQYEGLVAQGKELDRAMSDIKHDLIMRLEKALTLLV